MSYSGVIHVMHLNRSIGRFTRLAAFAVNGEDLIALPLPIDRLQVLLISTSNHAYIIALPVYIDLGGALSDCLGLCL